MKAYLTSEAEAELTEAVRFYAEHGSRNLAIRFVAEFEEKLRLIANFPGLGTPTSGGRRLLAIGRSPYSIVYRVEPDAVKVGAVAHQSRRPGYWTGRR